MAQPPSAVLMRICPSGCHGCKTLARSCRSTSFTATLSRKREKGCSGVRQKSGCLAKSTHWEFDNSP